MSTEQSNTDGDEFDHLEHRPLKTISIESVESAFAHALKELTGIEYKVKLNNVDFNPDASAWYRDMARMELAVEKKIANPFTSPLAK